MKSFHPENGHKYDAINYNLRWKVECIEYKMKIRNFQLQVDF